jgi:hypothetical protein
MLSSSWRSTPSLCIKAVMIGSDRSSSSVGSPSQALAVFDESIAAAWRRLVVDRIAARGGTAFATFA